ncbi:uncharacterized protein LOC120108427 [Phoenix dactylifera]|uniref:Uncharacterized protein LOC103716588 n=1 Tax=Phoenix dactylifera TaxID=42345 RepID=A0A8B7CNC4_PHODC|nr:uncharacterized protein LOC103716588 [Phoenix dactylifera]XP_038977963.1 uncharacterized protein LOC120108427 [Phoenix dactylifera]
MMNYQMSPMDRRPPLAVSPRRLRSGRALHTTPTVQTRPPTCKNSEFSSRPSSSMKSLIRPVYQMISPELMALAKRAKEEFGSNDDMDTTLASSSTSSSSSPMFERGRFYEVYSARRNERLKRKKEIADELVSQDPGIAIELAKRRNSKNVNSVRKSVPADFSSSRVNSLRSSVRSSKEMKKPSSLTCSEKPAAIGKVIGARSARKV